MKNLVQDGKNVKLPVTASASSGDFERVGALNAVLIKDEENGMAPCALQGVYTLSVIHAADVNIGDELYWNGSAIDDVDNGDIVGIALSAVTGAATSNINIRLHN